MKAEATKLQPLQASSTRAPASESVRSEASPDQRGAQSNHRPAAMALRQLQGMANRSPRLQGTARLQSMIEPNPGIASIPAPLVSLASTQASGIPVAPRLQQRVPRESSGFPVQRATEMTDEDWTRESAAKYMMNKQEGLGGQNKANASIWYNTLFSPGLAEGHPDYNQKQEDILKDQQAMLKRHFVAMAVLGVQGGNQFTGEKEEAYRPIEDFQTDGVSANLATLASGGGRFNYRSEDGTGDAFNRFLMMGSPDSGKSLNEVRDNSASHGGGQPESYLGAYKRIGTHGEDFSTGHIQEVDKTTGGIDSTGFDIPIGGVGLALHDAKDRAVTTGYQGVSEATQRGSHIGSDTTKYQTGHGFHRHATKMNQSLTQIAFEGSGPGMDNIHGGSHGVVATIGKKVFGGASAKTLTGQDKRSKLGLPGEVGGIKADVTREGLMKLEHVYNLLNKLGNNPNERPQQKEKEFYKRLLASETAQERQQIVDEIVFMPMLKRAEREGRPRIGRRLVTGPNGGQTES